MSLFEELEKNARKTLEDIGNHVPMIYMDKKGVLISYLLIFDQYTKAQAMRHFREMVTKENIPIYWTVTESWISQTRGILPEDDVNRREMLIISEYDGETMENRKILLPFEREFDVEELLAMSERQRELALNNGFELPKLTQDDLKDPEMRNILHSINPDKNWAGKIAWGQKEAFTIGLDSGEIHWVDRWDFYREDISAEIDEKMEKQRIEELVKEIREMDLTEGLRFAERMRDAIMSDGIELPPIPPEDVMREILIEMAESGSLIKIEGPVDIHEAVKQMKESDPNISSDHIHAMGDE